MQGRSVELLPLLAEGNGLGYMVSKVFGFELIVPSKVSVGLSNGGLRRVMEKARS